MKIGQKDRNGRDIQVGDIIEIETSFFILQWIITEDNANGFIHLSDGVIINR